MVLLLEKVNLDDLLHLDEIEQWESTSNVLVLGVCDTKPWEVKPVYMVMIVCSVHSQIDGR